MNGFAPRITAAPYHFQGCRTQGFPTIGTVTEFVFTPPISAQIFTFPERGEKIVAWNTWYLRSGPDAGPTRRRNPFPDARNRTSSRIPVTDGCCSIEIAP